MMGAGKFAAAIFDFTQHTPDDGAQGFLDDGIVRDQAVGRLFAHALLGGARRVMGQAL